MKKDKKIVGVSGIGVSEGSVLARQGWPYDDQNTHLEKENEIKNQNKARMSYSCERLIRLRLTEMML